MEGGDGGVDPGDCFLHGKEEGGEVVVGVDVGGWGSVGWLLGLER